jgi:hypothetical protein
MPGKQWVPKFISDLLDAVNLSTDGTFAANSDALIPTQKAVKTYVTANGGGALPVHDNTSASSDYALAVGETAKITFSAATSLPLHIATAQGEYELIVIGDASVAPSNNNLTALTANNTNNSWIWGDIFNAPFSLTTGSTGNAPTGWVNSGVTGATIASAGTVIQVRANISTFTKAKAVLSQAQILKTGSTPFQPEINNSFWNDTTTAWASLGTLTFPFAQNGTVIIRRIL